MLDPDVQQQVVQRRMAVVAQRFARGRPTGSWAMLTLSASSSHSDDVVENLSTAPATRATTPTATISVVAGC